MKYRLCPDDDYSTDEGVTLESAFRKEQENGALAAAVSLIFCSLADAGMISEDEILSVLNAGRFFGPDHYLRWEIAR